MIQALSLVLAFAGLGITLWGRWLKTYSPFQQHLFLWGAVLLGIGAVLDYEPVLIVFECIIVFGCIIGFFTFPNLYKSLAIAGTAVIGIIVLVVSSAAVTWLLVLGMTGLVLGSAGFATRSAYVQIISSIVIATYNILQFDNGNEVSAVFALLNIIFGVLAVRALRTATNPHV